jgi:hypothetical protein
MAVLIAEEYWRPAAACRSADPDLFFPVSSSGKALPARSQWDRKAAAHAEIFHLLAEVADDLFVAGEFRVGAGHMHDLMTAVGPAADGMIASSRRRLLAHLRAGDAEEAALEMEKHLRGLHYMWRLTRCSA